VSQERKRQTGHVLLKKLSQNTNEPEILARIIERQVKIEGSQEEVLEELIQCFLRIQNTLKKHSAPFPFPLSQLACVFHQVAQKKGIKVDQFYPSLLERIFREEEMEGLSQSPPKPSTRAKILDAALDLFSKKGFHSTTVDEIAEHAGVGKGTFYRNFANKEVLFNELMRLRLEDLEQRAQAVLDGQDDVLTMITKYLHIYFEFFDQNQHLYRLIVQEQLDVGDQVQDLYVRRVMRRIPVLKRKIYEATQQGILKEVDFQTVFYGVMGFIHGVIQKWLAHDCSYSLVQELSTVKEILFYGFVRTRQ
jgi:AcrR family transcriptional regulator